MCLAVSEVRDL